MAILLLVWNLYTVHIQLLIIIVSVFLTHALAGYCSNSTQDNDTSFSNNLNRIAMALPIPPKFAGLAANPDLPVRHTIELCACSVSNLWRECEILMDICRS